MLQPVAGLPNLSRVALKSHEYVITDIHVQNITYTFQYTGKYTGCDLNKDCEFILNI